VEGPVPETATPLGWCIVKPPRAHDEAQSSVLQSVKSLIYW